MQVWETIFGNFLFQLDSLFRLHLACLALLIQSPIGVSNNCVIPVTRYLTMNYLAHLYLAEDSPESLIGNLLGDFVKGRSIDTYGDEIKKGIQLHQKVDIYTDSHPIVRESKRLISPVNRRYSGIIVDVFYDHFLAINWLDYSSISLKEFTAKAYSILEQNEAILPDSIKRVLPNIINRNVLMSYVEIQGINYALQRISLRLKRENNLGSASEELIANYERFKLDFSRFFPELIDYVKTLRYKSKS